MRAKSVLRTAEPSARATQRGASVARKKKEAARRASERAAQLSTREIFPVKTKTRGREKEAQRHRSDRGLQDLDGLLDGLLLRRAHLGPLREVLDEHVAAPADLSEVARGGHDLLLVLLEVRLELRERELRGLELGLEAVARVHEVRARLLVGRRGGLEVRDLLRLLRLEVLLAGREVLARGLEDLHHVAAALLHVAARQRRHLRHIRARPRQA